MEEISQDLLREVFIYDDKKGSLIFKAKPETTRENRRWNTRYAGKPCGSINSGGYLHVKLRGKKYKVHRMVYLFVHGKLPQIIDHIDGDKTNNRVSNLRPATYSENNKNSKKGANNTSGHKGVSWHKQHRKWYATITSSKKVHFIGLFEEIDDAIKAVEKERRRLHGDFARYD